ncbi:hypothetical protein EDD15DRAFT_2371945 [Pisolithus albus]|nr:hypothetical protein EDD15DRAFT_2371945 [Pisolithus albus]
MAEVKALQAEVRTLKDKLYNYIATHEACCQRSDSSSSTSSEAADDNDIGNPPPPSPAQPPFELVTYRPDGISMPVANPPSWLTTILSHIDLPPSFSGVLYVPEHTDILPATALDVLKLHFRNSPPFCLAVDRDRSLWTVDSANVDRAQITTIIKLPPDPSIPTALA